MAGPADPEGVDRHIASLDYELAKADATERLKFQASFSQIGWRSLALVNGGAIVALFTFIGNAHPRVDGSLVWLAFALFVGGLTANIFSILGGFFAQAFYMKAAVSTAWNKQAEMHGQEPKYVAAHRKEFRNGNGFEYFAIAAAVLSLLLFAAGARSALEGVTVAPAASKVTAEHLDAPGANTGRFQIVNNGDGPGVYVLDTANGQLRLCMTGQVHGPGTIGIACMAPSPVLRGPVGQDRL